MSDFLFDKKLSEKIKLLMKAENPRCAVAFWGKGAKEALLFDIKNLSNLRIICDITMGGTNPSELENLGAPKNENIRHIPGLHSKVYISDAGLVISSANASRNGLGLSEQFSLHEAGSFHDCNSRAYRDALEWFDKMWEFANIVDKEALELAKNKWKYAGQITLNVGNSHGYDKKSLIETVIYNQEKFRGVGFAFTSGEATDEQRDEAAENIIEQYNNQEIKVILDYELNSIPQWPIDDVFSEWSPEDIQAWPEKFICIHKQSREKILYYVFRREHSTVIDGTRGMIFAKKLNKKSAMKEFGFHYNFQEMAKTDAEIILTLFNNHHDEHFLFENSEILAREIREHCDI